MSGGKPRYLFDSVHGLLRFDAGDGELLFRLINCKELQRLRRIQQLGMSPFVFPGADHSRFAHSIGMLHTTRCFLDRLKEVAPVEITPEQRTVLLAGALLHDVGHGPYSHVFEKVAKDKHEKRTMQVITTAGTEVNEVLSKVDPTFPEKVATLFGAPSPADWDMPAYLNQVISSQLDADRFDYLKRDSHYTGVDYGVFDVRWLIEHLFVDGTKKLFVSQKAMDAVENYVFARYHMYKAVYYHKATRAGEVMLRLLLRRYARLLREEGVETAEKIVPEVPREVVKAFSDDGNTALDDYLNLDDHVMTVFLRRCTDSSDQYIRELGEGLLHRRLWKCVEFTQHPAGDVVELVDTVRAALEKSGEDIGFFEKDAPGDIAYKPYEPGKDNLAEQIFLECNGELKELASISKPVAQLTERYSLIRYYFPERLRSIVRESIESWEKR